MNDESVTLRSTHIPPQAYAALLGVCASIAAGVYFRYSQSIPCGVMHPTLPESFRVISYWDRSIVSTGCERRTPRQIAVDRADFSLEILLDVDEDPSVAIDAFSHGSVSAVVVGDSLRAGRDTPSGRVTMFAQASRLPNRVLEFQVVDKVTKSTTEYRLPFELIACSCRRGDGP